MSGWKDERWKGITREYSYEDVLRLRGSWPSPAVYSRLLSEKFWRMLKSRPYVFAIGAMTGTQAIQMVDAGFEAIYVSGWQVAADANEAGMMYPDLGLYPSNSGPALVRRILRALWRADQIRNLEGRKRPDYFVPLIADCEAGFGGPLLVREGKSMRLEAIADPQEVLQRIYSGWARTVTLSATISAELLEAILGEEVTLLRAGWPYGDNLKAVVVTGLTTKYEKRDAKMIEDIRWVLALATRKGERALAFLPSFDILQEAVKGVDVLYEDRGLSQEVVDRLVSEFSSGNKPLVAVYNGRLGEGIDLSAPLVFLVGVPFSPPTARTTKLLKRLSEIVGDEGKAKLYGVILPGLWSALQAAGRAIRGPEDSADVYLIDDRYRTMIRLLPR